MIGVFDSGYGGLTILKALTEALLEFDFVYLGDNARVPYGSRSAEEIFQFTLQGVEELFRRGCPLVILACNTSSANALRRIQQEVLPMKYPDKRVLGILVPTVEQFCRNETTPSPSLERRGDACVVGILATEATVRSEAYVHEAAQRAPGATVVQQACPDLVPLIEAGVYASPGDATVVHQVAHSYLKALFSQNEAISTVLLGCTHYALIADLIGQSLPKGVKLLTQSALVAESLKAYLDRHPEIVAQLTAGRGRQFLTTGDASEVSRLGTKFFGAPIAFDHIALT